MLLLAVSETEKCKAQKTCLEVFQLLASRFQCNNWLHAFIALTDLTL